MILRNLSKFQQKLQEGAERRQEALRRLADRGTSTGPDSDARAALGVLHQLALSPESAAQALALLQEFQVHQIELDAQIESSRQALADADAALLQQTRLHDRLPVACVRIDEAGHLLACNRTACQWLGLDVPAPKGLLFGAFLSPADEAGLQHRLGQVNQGWSPTPWRLDLLTPDRTSRPMQAAISADDQPDHYIVVLMDRAPA
ncbi:MAG: hypothetical protein RI907_3669 [Pseudomonadota bacterium]|jgi:PAS domain-containing protein